VLACVAFGVSLGAAAASADPTYSVSGTVSDPSGAPVAGMTVSLSGSTDDPVSTDSSGGYTFTGLVDGSYTVVTTSTASYPLVQSAGVAVVDADVDGVALTDPRFATISGTVNAGGSPADGVVVEVLDSTTSSEYGTAAPTGPSGTFSITVPSNSDGYGFLFSSSAAARLAIASYALGDGTVGVSNACAITVDPASQQALDAGGPVALTVTLNPDPTVCDPAATAPTAPQAQGQHTSPAVPQSTLALTGAPTAAATSAPSAAATQTPGVPVTTTFTATNSTKPLLATPSATAPMPWWGWALVIIAVLAMAGGVGFTVVRHR
jgi:hypothetical protein